MKNGKIIGAVCAFAAAVLTVSTLFTYSFITTTHAGGTVSNVRRLAAADNIAATAQVTRVEAPSEVGIQAFEQTVAPAPEASEKQDTAFAAQEADGDEEILGYAREALRQCTDSSMSREEKLKRAFKYLQDNYLEGSVRDTYTGDDWARIYAKDLFVGGKGDCFSYGAAFAYMAKAIGYTEAYACNSGGHGWAEVDGKIYDPEWSMHSSKYSYFGMSYDEPCDVGYKGAVGWAEWTHVQV